MPLFTWGPQYSVLVNEMDDQHKKLFDYANELNDAMLAGKGNAAMSGILNKLTAYVLEHFRDEEKLMKQHEYPALEFHAKEHAMLVEKVSQLKADHEAGRMMVSMKTLNFLRDWLQNHIQKEDRKYGEYILKKERK